MPGLPLGGPGGFTEMSDLQAMRETSGQIETAASLPQAGMGDPADYLALLSREAA